MVRTIISLDSESKAWLDDQARKTGQSMTAVVRDAVNAYRTREAEHLTPLRADLIEQTRGLWKQGDGLVWQNKMRAEWDAR